MKKHQISDSQSQTILEASRKIEYKGIKVLASKGNPAAQIMLNDPYHATHEDLSQSIALAIWENMEWIVFSVSDNPIEQQLFDLSHMGITFTDYTYNGIKWRSEIKTKVYQTIQNGLYALIQKEHRRQAFSVCEIDESRESGNKVIGEKILSRAAYERYMSDMTVEDNRLLVDSIIDSEYVNESDRAVMILYRDGYTMTEIGVKVGRSKQAISKQFRAIARKISPMR